METFQLAGRAVRITWAHQLGRSLHNDQTVFRGEVTHEEATGLWLYGSFFIEKAETLSLRETAMVGEDESHLFFVPWSSIEAVQVIAEDSKDFEVHRLILARRDERAKRADPFLK